MPAMLNLSVHGSLPAQELADPEKHGPRSFDFAQDEGLKR